MPRLGAWIGASAVDVGIRLTAQMLGTIVIARLLPAEDFGLAMLALSVVALIGAFIGLPFEEALAQRRRVTTGHLGSALFVSLALTVAAIVLTLLCVPLFARWAGAPDLVIWLPLATVFLLGQGPGSIARALARRHRRFVELAVCQSLSVVIATGLAIGLALAGHGVLALVSQRMVPVVLYPPLAVMATLRRGGRAFPRPVFIKARFAEIFRFSWIYLTDTGVHYATPAMLTFFVNAHFGTATLGLVNIAMRLAEPLRLGIQGVGHNLVFSFLSRMQHDPRRLARASLEVVTRMATLAVPTFLGLAVTAPLVLPILVGPGWDEAVPLARAFCLVAAINVPFWYLYSGFSALGRPEFGLAGSVLGFVTTLVGLLVAARVDLTWAIGAAVVASEMAIAALGLCLVARQLGREIWAPLSRIAGVWVAGGGMAALLGWALARWGGVGGPVAVLIGTIFVGLLLYPPLLFVFCRPCFDFIWGTIPRRKGYDL